MPDMRQPKPYTAPEVPLPIPRPEEANTLESRLPQWPFMPAIEGPVPLPPHDPRSAMAKALMYKAPIPMPRSDPRDWAARAVQPQAENEADSLGAIHPDALMNARGIQPPTSHSIDRHEWMGRPGGIPAGQYPIGIPPPIQQQDAGNGLFGVPSQHLQQMAGDVVKGPWSLQSQDTNRFMGGKGPDVPFATPFDPKGDFTGGSKVIPLPLPGMLSANTPPKPPPPKPTGVDSLIDWGSSDKLAPMTPPMYWKPG